MATNSTGKFLGGSLLGFLVIAFIVGLIYHRMQAVVDDVLPNVVAMDEASIVERIAPVGQVNVGDTAEFVPVASAAPAVIDTVHAGQQVYDNVCAMCHSIGMMQSPRTNNAGDWLPRLEKGIDQVYANAINGINMMPARGGNPNLSDDEVKAAVDYMIADVR